MLLKRGRGRLDGETARNRALRNQTRRWERGRENGRRRERDSDRERIGVERERKNIDVLFIFFLFTFVNILAPTVVILFVSLTHIHVHVYRELSRQALFEQKKKWGKMRIVECILSSLLIYFHK